MKATSIWMSSSFKSSKSLSSAETIAEMTKDELKALGKSILSILIKKSHKCHFKCKYTQRKGTHKCEWLRRI
jgi:hypothetical protein